MYSVPKKLLLVVFAFATSFAVVAQSLKNPVVNGTEVSHTQTKTELVNADIQLTEKVTLRANRATLRRDSATNQLSSVEIAGAAAITSDSVEGVANDVTYRVGQPYLEASRLNLRKFGAATLGTVSFSCRSGVLSVNNVPQSGSWCANGMEVSCNGDRVRMTMAAACG